MKKMILFLPLFLMIGAALTFTSCKKVDSTTQTDDVSAEDEKNVSDAMNATADDATAAAGQVKNVSGKTDGWWHLLCGATAVDTGTSHQITITYDGNTTCDGITRSGTVMISLDSSEWRMQNATLTVTLNLTITRVLTGAHYTLTGTQTLTNETGGLAWRVMAGLAAGPVSHRHKGNVTVTYADGQQRAWTIDRTRTFTYNSSTDVRTIALASEATGNVDATGTNVNGNTFTNTITTAIIANSNCTWKPYQGETSHVVNNKTVTITFGVDNTGAVVGSPTNCAWGYQITFTKNNVVKTKLVQYW